MLRASSLIFALSLSAPALWAAEAPLPDKIEFNRDIRPIVSDTCFHCHGPDKNARKAKLRLDIREDALGAGESGEVAIVPHHPESSEVIRRLFTDDQDDLMPPPKANKPLTARQKELFKRWIAQGAEYQMHWSYEPPVKAAIPAATNAVDFLIQKRLSEIGLKPSPEADRRTLIRRLYFDLLGLPPTIAEVDQFVADSSPDAYAKVVDRVLQNPHYGERMAIGWLDVVRFADTIGYHSDNGRNVWPYRDWVIRAFNDNKRFDQFTIEQIAGDLVPNATNETRVGSAFNRLLLSTEEGGAQAKDYEARMVTDRVRAIGAAWLGQTTGCCQCHDHKFDPLTQRDFYSLGAFFADIKEPIIGRREDGMLVISAEQEATMKKLDQALAAAQKKLDAVVPELDAAQRQWEADLVEYKITLPELQKDSKATPAEQKEAREIEKGLKTEKPTAKEKEATTKYFRTKVTKLFPAERDGFAKADAERRNFYDPLPKCIVSVSSPQKRTLRILPRGNWMDESGEIVKAALPHFLPQPKIEGREPTRLDLGRWLVSRENPLTARTVMNRLWKQLFGMGISKVLDDLGAQGEPPVNPALLDWLACEFMDSGWDMKHMVRVIVTSGAYRQVSTVTSELLARDPYNREYARQSRFRVEAEIVRDNALAIAGLLSPKIGGPSVRPYQPDGYWDNLNFPPRKWQADTGENQYRRGLYTWWQRSYLHPSLAAFDAPSREECTAERNRSNIPQQALVLLNDPTYVEAARVFAARILTEGRGTPEQRIEWAWRQTLQRPPRPEELATARALFDQQLAIYQTDLPAAAALLKTGQAAPSTLDQPELAAWTHIARVLLNLHETITRS